MVVFNDTEEVDSIAVSGFKSILPMIKDHAEILSKDVVALRFKKYHQQNISNDLYM